MAPFAAAGSAASKRTRDSWAGRAGARSPDRWPAGTYVCTGQRIAETVQMPFRRRRIAHGRSGALPDQRRGAAIDHVRRDLSARRDHRFPNGISLRGPRAVENVFFDVAVTRIIREAKLEVTYDWVLARDEAVLELWLNGTRVAELAPVAGHNRRADVSLPADLLTTDNTLSFHLSGTCAACGIGTPPWITVSPTTALRVRGRGCRSRTICRCCRFLSSTQSGSARPSCRSPFLRCRIRRRSRPRR